MSATPISAGFAPIGAVVAARKRLQRRYGLVVLGLALLSIAVVGLSLSVGDHPLPLADVVRSLLSPLTGDADSANDFIVLGVRLPRVVAGLLSGGAFGLSGVIFQTILRNPLASPDIVGITTGASAAAVLAIIAFGWSGLAVSFSACSGAILIALLIYGLAWRNGVTPYRLVLIGIGMSALAGAVVSYLFTRARIMEVQEALSWLTGSLNGASFEGLAPLAIALVILVPLAAILSRSLQTLQLGDDTATALGTRVEFSRVGLILVAVLVAAFATAAVGPVSFVAFVAGPIARRLLGPSGGALIPAALVGGLVTNASDFVAQHMLGRNQLPVGVVTGALGAVFLIYLLAAAHRSGRGG
jgi:iron complex transport system permease protein